VTTPEVRLFEDENSGVDREGDLRTVAKLNALMSVKGLGPKKALQVAKNIGSMNRLSELSGHDLELLIGREAAANLRAASLDVAPPMAASDGSVVGFFDADYPAILRAIPDPPPLLWTRGRMADSVAVAVVGTRKPTDWSIRTARLIVESAVSRGIVIVSGLALGTDTTAHEACLAAGGVTIAILGSGLDNPSPAANRGLADRIVDAGGCLLAEVPPGTRPSAHSLVARDRLQSGLSVATVVIQSGIPGGTLHTARFAIEQDRLLVVALPIRSAAPLSSPDPYAGNLALTDSAGCDPAVLRAVGPVAAKIALRRPAADMTIAREEDLNAVWARVEELRLGGTNPLPIEHDISEGRPPS
jgi:DNA processing protein